MSKKRTQGAMWGLFGALVALTLSVVFVKVLSQPSFDEKISNTYPIIKKSIGRLPSSSHGYRGTIFSTYAGDIKVMEGNGANSLTTIAKTGLPSWVNVNGSIATPTRWCYILRYQQDDPNSLARAGKAVVATAQQGIMLVYDQNGLVENLTSNAGVGSNSSTVNYGGKALCIKGFVYDATGMVIVRK